MIEPQTGQPTLVLDELLVLDGATGDQVSSWESPREQLIKVGRNNQAFFTIEYYGAGAGIGTTGIYVQRTAMYDSDEEEFENMNSSAISLSSGHNWTSYRFGRDPSTATDKSPMGLLRLYVDNTHASNQAFVRVRVWVCLQAYVPERVGRPGPGRREPGMGRGPMRGLPR